MTGLAPSRGFSSPSEGAARRSTTPTGRCHNRSTTSGPAARSIKRPSCGPIPGNAVADANSLSRRVERILLPIITRKADAAKQDRYIEGIMPTPDPEIRRKRLLFRAWHRGTREADLILGSFAEAHLAGFDVAQLDRFEAMRGLRDVGLESLTNTRDRPSTT